MKIEDISSSQGRALIIMFILGTSLIIGGDPSAKEDIWISILLAIIVALPIVFIYGRLNQLFPGKGLFDILAKVYGKFLGSFFILSYTLYFIFLGAIDLRHSTEYIQVVSLPNTPQYVTGILLGILCIYAINAGLTVISTWAKMVLLLIVLLILTVFLLGIPQFNFNNIKPILYNGWKPVITSGYSMLTFPFCETVIFLVFCGYLQNKKDITKVYIGSIIIGGLLILVSALRNIFLLGFPILNNIYFRSHYSTSIINIENFIQRIEVVVSVSLLLTSFIKTVVCIYASSIGVYKLFKPKNFGKIPFVITIITIILSMVLFRNTMEAIGSIKIYRYYVIPFQFIIPALTLICALIRKKFQNI